MRVEIDGIRYIPERKRSSQRKPLHLLLSGLRELRGETLEQASSGMGISKSHLHGLEKGSMQPRLDTLKLLLAYYRIDFDEIA